MSILINAIKEREQKYLYRIRTVADVDIDELVFFLRRHHLVGISDTTVVMNQPGSMFFPSYPNSDINIVDFELSVPTSPYLLERILTGDLGLSDGLLMVFGEDNPYEANTQELTTLKAIDAKAESEGMIAKSLMSTSPEYSEVDDKGFGDYYGEKSILAAIANTPRAKSIIVTNELSLANDALTGEEAPKEIEDQNLTRHGSYKGKPKKFKTFLDSNSKEHVEEL